MTYKDEILQTLFGGGTGDYAMLEKCNYDFEEVLSEIEGFTTRNEMTFNDILLGAISLYKRNIQAKIDKVLCEIEYRLKELQDEEDWESGSLSQAEYDEYDRLQTERNDLESICVYDDIEYFINYIDTHIFINDEITREVYRNYLKDFIDEENQNIGFVYLDLD